MTDAQSQRPRLPQYPRESPCSVCGANEFQWGGVTLDETNRGIYFRLEGTTYEDGDAPVMARRCTHCGNMLLFADW
jgi:hypothetical protein